MICGAAASFLGRVCIRQKRFHEPGMGRRQNFGGAFSVLRLVLVQEALDACPAFDVNRRTFAGRCFCDAAQCGGCSSVG